MQYLLEWVWRDFKQDLSKTCFKWSFIISITYQVPKQNKVRLLCYKESFVLLVSLLGISSLMSFKDVFKSFRLLVFKIFLLTLWQLLRSHCLLCYWRDLVVPFKLEMGNSQPENRRMTTEKSTFCCFLMWHILNSARRIVFFLFQVLSSIYRLSSKWKSVIFSSFSGF